MLIKNNRMMFRFLAATVIALSVTVTARAQDPTETLPDAYRVVLDNEYVRVVRVHYDPGVKLPAHTHPTGTTAYVYLNDSDGVVFRHVGGMNSVVTRPAVKTGAMRLSSGMEEHHEVENTSTIASDFLRIQLKTVTGGNVRRRIAPDEVEFSDKDIHITRLRVKPGQTLQIETKKAPALRIAIREGVKQWTTPPADFVRWLDKGTTEDFAVTGDFPVDIIKIEFLTKPK
jgi:hypothetical protein